MADASDRRILRLTRALEAAQAERRRRILKWVENHGAASAAEHFGLSRQRVWAMAKQERERLAKEAKDK